MQKQFDKIFKIFLFIINLLLFVIVALVIKDQDQKIKTANALKAIDENIPVTDLEISPVPTPTLTSTPTPTPIITPKKPVTATPKATRTTKKS
ncbi:MAG: hypothetical protein WCK16_04295 [Candidatus Moraniibacteriota bacterium]